jgi:hypothetical protein
MHVGLQVRETQTGAKQEILLVAGVPLREIIRVIKVEILVMSSFRAFRICIRI